MTTKSDGDKLPPEEAFANAYFYFIEALKILAEEADVQCSRMGNFNVAWEIKDDVSGGAWLLDLPSSLSPREKDGIIKIVAALEKIPASVLDGQTTAASNLRAMRHPCWIPLRALASELITLLSDATRRNEAYLRGNGEA